MSEISIDTINIIGGKPDKDEEIDVRIRYRQNLFKCTVDIDKKRVYFKESQTVDAGQSVVFYRGDECLGGVIIAE